GMISRIGPVTAVQETGSTSAAVYRSPLVPSTNTNGLSVQAASLDLPAAVGATMAAGRYLNAATAREPVAVLGAVAAQRLGIDRRQPPAALTARAEAQSALNSLFLGLGAISLLVGAVGVGNIMLIGVLERRSEIGLRRSLGATKGHIRTQFLSEAILLALLGG